MAEGGMVVTAHQPTSAPAWWQWWWWQHTSWHAVTTWWAQIMLMSPGHSTPSASAWLKPLFYYDMFNSSNNMVGLNHADVSRMQPSRCISMI